MSPQTSCGLPFTYIQISRPHVRLAFFSIILILASPRAAFLALVEPHTKNSLDVPICTLSKVLTVPVIFAAGDRRLVRMILAGHCQRVEGKMAP